jgi:hypothetical protein
MNVLQMIEKFKQYIQDYGCNAHAWSKVKCEHYTFADLGHATSVHHLIHIYILYINSVSPSVRQLVEVLKPISLLLKLSPRTRGPKNYSGPRVLTSYFYFYVRFRAATAVVDGGGIFGIWRVGEEIWMHFFCAKGLGGS